jgi:hypothetical protein
MFRSVPLHEDVNGNGGVAPQTLELGTVRMALVSFTSWSL